MTMSDSKFRQNVYRALDRVLETGEPLDVERNGKLVRIAAIDPPKKLDRLKRREGVLLCDPEDIVHVDWSREWRP